MKKLLLLILCASSLHAGIGVQNTILCLRYGVPREQQWASLTIDDFINKLPQMNKSQQREVVTYSDKRGWFDGTANWGWARAKAKIARWQYIKDYYIITLRSPEHEEDLYVTGDQSFRCPTCRLYDQATKKEDKQEARRVSNTYFDWVTAETLYKRFDPQNPDCTTIFRSPTTVDGQNAKENTARIVSFIKVEEQDNHPHEFFDFTIDTKDNSYIVGKGHYWVKGFTRK